MLVGLARSSKIIFIVVLLCLFIINTIHSGPIEANIIPPKVKTLGDLEIGDRVVDDNSMWEHRLWTNYNRVNHYDEAVKPITWIVVAKDHYDINESHVTLMAEDLIGRYQFDNSTNRGSKAGSNHWGDSGSYNAEYGLRTFLDGKFKVGLSFFMQQKLLVTPLPNAVWDTGKAYFTEDQVFIFSETELGHENNQSIGSMLPYFDLEHVSGPQDSKELLIRRRGELPGWSEAYPNSKSDYYQYSTRSPSATDSNTIRVVDSEGTISSELTNINAGVRPAINLPADLQVSSLPYQDGAYRIISQAETYNVLYIPAKYPGDDCPQPTRSVEELKQRAEWVKRYFYRESYGRVIINSSFASDEWMVLENTKSQYVGSGWQRDVLEDGIELAGVDSDSYDAVVVIAPDSVTQRAAFCLAERIPGTNPIEMRILNKVYIDDGFSYGVWAHELGHALFKWYDYYTKARYIHTRGDTRTWGLMGYGPFLNPVSPIIAHNKEKSGWLEYRNIGMLAGGEHDIFYLNRVDENSSVLRLALGEDHVDYFIFEGRHPTEGLPDQDTWLEEEEVMPEQAGILMYKLQKREKGDDDAVMGFNWCATEQRFLTEYDISGMYVYTLPWIESSSNSLYQGNVTIQHGETYYDDPTGLEFTAQKVGSELKMVLSPSVVLDRQIIILERVTLSYPSYPGALIMDPPVAENHFDVDLKVICSAGRMVGMDYETGEYLNEIPGSRTSGNILAGGPEWISVPKNIDFSYVLDTTPAEKWMEELNITEMRVNARIKKVSVDGEGERTETVEEQEFRLGAQDHFEPGVYRLSGDCRYETAVEISKSGWESSGTVLLARGDDYADALAGVPLAYHLDAPILLTPTAALHEATEAEIERLGANKVILLGGTAAISGAVKDELEGNNLTVDRISGANRYQTAGWIADRLKNEGAVFDTAFIAVGTNFADALAASSYAAMRGEPILLTETKYLPPDTAAAINQLGITRTYVCGGTAAVSNEAYEMLPEERVRLWGENRYETALALANKFLPDGAKHVGIATGRNYPDAVAGGVWAAKYNTGILLVDGTKSEPCEKTQEFLEDRGITGVTLYGGPSAVSSEMEDWFEPNLGE